MRFYVYQDPRTNKYYFHNPITNQILWNPPKDALICDPKTLEEIKPQFLQENNVEYETEIQKTPRRRNTEDPDFASNNTFSSNDSVMVPNENDVVSTHRFNSHRRRSSSRSRTSSIKVSASLSEILTPPADLVPPDSMLNDGSVPKKHKMRSKHVNDTDELYFTGSLLEIKNDPNKKYSFVENFITNQTKQGEMTNYQTKYKTILKSAEKFLKIFKDKIFKLIMDNSVSPERYALEQKLIDIVKTDPQNLIDETFMLLYQQTRGNPSPESEERIWRLLLAMSTMFKPTIYECTFFLREEFGHLTFKTKNKRISSLALLCFLRIRSRMLSPLKIDLKFYTEEVIFGESLNEQLFRQRNSNPELKIPLFLKLILTSLREGGVFNQEKVLQSEVNRNQLNSIIDQIRYSSGGDIPNTSEAPILEVPSSNGIDVIQSNPVASPSVASKHKKSHSKLKFKLLGKDKKKEEESPAKLHQSTSHPFMSLRPPQDNDDVPVMLNTFSSKSAKRGLGMNLFTSSALEAIDFDNFDLQTRAALFKLWMTELPESFVKNNYLKYSNNEGPLVIVEQKISPASRYALGTIVGFFKEIIQNEAETKTSLDDILTLFGNLIIRGDKKDPKKVGTNFLKELIEQWDTSFTYPSALL